MPGETKSDISGWTVDTLKAYVERLFEEHDKRYEQRFRAQQQSLTDALTSSNLAVDKAESISEKWRQNANEWRAAMSDRDKAYLTKEAADIKFTALDKEINEAHAQRTRAEGRQDVKNETRQTQGWVIPLIILSIIAIINMAINIVQLTHK